MVVLSFSADCGVSGSFTEKKNNYQFNLLKVHGLHLFTWHCGLSSSYVVPEVDN